MEAALLLAAFGRTLGWGAMLTSAPGARRTTSSGAALTTLSVSTACPSIQNGKGTPLQTTPTCIPTLPDTHGSQSIMRCCEAACGVCHLAVLCLPWIPEQVSPRRDEPGCAALEPARPLRGCHKVVSSI